MELIYLQYSSSNDICGKESGFREQMQPAESSHTNNEVNVCEEGDSCVFSVCTFDWRDKEVSSGEQ